MNRLNFRKTLFGSALIGGIIAATRALADGPQGGYGPGSGMMGGSGSGWMGGYGSGWMGGYGGIGLPILVVIVVAGLVAWIVSQKKK